ncbi:type II and III secretion system protein family protein [Noviherbaspirillum galbum]|uniref:Type II and III secretion system protein family protein n=1 Tax=Noviherbaspirillum galbum TaxID=2709383 RepID=A0A6B3SJY2_9BURK|nr:type II and III secretion system protein family protein [Noviherbaspirillum galbum]
MLLAALLVAGYASAQSSPAARKPNVASPGGQATYTAGIKQCAGTVVDKPAVATLGKSTVVPLDYPVVRIAIGGNRSTVRANAAPQAPAAEANAAGAAAPPAPPPAAAGAGNDGVSEVSISLLGPRELFVLGRQAGAMNVVLQGADGRCHVKDIIVTIDPGALQSVLAELMPGEPGIKVRGAENALVLTGNVSDSLKVDQAVALATSYGDGKKVLNMLRVTSPQQVMLEVKIAEVSKTLLDKLGSSVGIRRSGNGGTDTYSLLSNFLSNGGGLVEALRVGRTALSIDGQKDDGLVRILAEPNIMAISGQHASFLSGGKIFIPTAQTNLTGTPIITLTEKEFGIGVKFMPTVLEGNRVNLKLTSEVSDLSQTGSPFTTVNGITSVLPSLTVRRADTTVQLNDGQSLVIAGLIRNDVNETVKRFPGMGEVPVLGALFRSTEFQNNQSELMFVVTPRLVKPLPEEPRLPTDNHVVPSRGEVYMNGSLESATPASSTPMAP